MTMHIILVCAQVNCIAFHFIFNVWPFPNLLEFPIQIDQKKYGKKKQSLWVCFIPLSISIDKVFGKGKNITQLK